MSCPIHPWLVRWADAHGVTIAGLLPLSPPVGEAWSLLAGANASSFYAGRAVTLVVLAKTARPGAGRWTNENGTVRVGPGLFAINAAPNPRHIEQANGIPPALWDWLNHCPAWEVVFANLDRACSVTSETEPDLVTMSDGGTRLYDRARCLLWPMP